MRQVNRATESAREMETSASVRYGCSCMWATRGSAPPAFLPPVPPRNTLRDMDVHELGSPAATHEAIALSRAPLNPGTEHLSGPEVETAES